MPSRRPTGDEQVMAWSLAHRVVLAYLVKAVATALPEEGTAFARDATVTMLNNSFPRMMGGLDAASAARLTALAEQEVDRIFVAALGPVPPPADA